MLETIALMLPNWIGDLVMATPTLRAVRKRFPDAHLIGVMRTYVADCLEGTPWLNETLQYSRSGKEALTRWQLVKTLRQRRIDRMLLLPSSLSTAAIAWMGGARQRVGYARYARRMLLTDPLELERDGGAIRPTSAVDFYLKLAERIGCDVSNRNVELTVTPAEQEAAEDVWRRLKLASDRPVVTLNAGGAYGSAKRWPEDHCSRLAKLITRECEASVLVLCGPNEQEVARKVVAEADSPHVVSLADEAISIGLSKACIARSSLLVTTDSGPRHVAAAVGCPTLTLFGPTDPRWAENYNPRDTKLQLPLPCGPCGKRICPLGHRACMRDLTPERVLTTIKPMLCAFDRSAA